MTIYKKMTIGVSTALAAIGLTFAMLGVGNVPNYQPLSSCGPGQACTPASLATTGDVTVGDELYMSTDNYICLNGIPCTAYINHMGDGSTMISGSDVKFTVKTVGRFSTGLESLIATDREDHLLFSGTNSGNGAIINAEGPFNTDLRINAADAGTIYFNRATATVSATGAGVFTAVSPTANSHPFGRTLVFSKELDFGNIGPGEDEDITVDVTGAVVGDTIAPAMPASVDNGLVITMRVSAADTVMVRASNITLLTTINPASATFGGRLMR